MSKRIDLLLRIRKKEQINKQKNPQSSNKIHCRLRGLQFCVKALLVVTIFFVSHQECQHYLTICYLPLKRTVVELVCWIVIQKITFCRERVRQILATRYILQFLSFCSPFKCKPVYTYHSDYRRGGILAWIGTAVHHEARAFSY